MAPDHGMCCPMILKSFTVGLFSILVLSNINIKTALASHPPQWRPAPGDRIPYGFITPTLDGSFALNESLPVIIFAYEPTDAFLRMMWNSDASVLQFVEEAPTEVHYFFTSYGLDAAGDAGWMKERLLWATDKLNINNAEKEARLSHWHFSTLPLSGLSDVGANFIPYLMGRWRASKKILTASESGEPLLTAERLDASYDWLPAPPQDSGALSFFGNGCNDPSPYDLAGQVAFVVQEDSSGWSANCSHAHIISAAQAANATGVVISAEPGSDVEQMGCNGMECDLPLKIWATMLPYREALQIRQELAAGKKVKLSFTDEDRPGYFAAVNENLELAEVGWLKFPKLMHIGWAAQWLQYETELRANLSRPALVVPIFKEQIMQGEQGVVAHVKLPTAAEQAEYDTLELDFTLSCPGTLDADCPIWDHVVQLFVCCEDAEGRTDHCDKCDVTPWMAMSHNDPSGVEWREERLSLASQGFGSSGEACGKELGRWITPFRRRIGRWLTDVTPLWPLLSSRHCRFQAQTAPWALPWKPSLNLRFSKTQESLQGSAKGGNAFHLLPLFTGGTFDAHFNSEDERRPIRFATPKGTQRAILEAVITGHGSDENNCAEFCVTNHRFSINGKEHWVNFTQAGTAWGCTTKVGEGMIPNEHGTWQYGRNGWCDGQNVRPWLADVTADLLGEGGGENVAEYIGLFEGRDPDPETTPGFIMMESAIIFFRGSETSARYDMAVA
ncbi:hypothetical protein COCOBI_14-1860 [Coccomyxa sp. Obi]|nr:hypothetical protein COCOBI_14-1860 [Coccomyxa sp. Obi]